jgi:hypothetical protein
MKKNWTLMIAIVALSAFAAAQVAAGSSASAGASVTPGQANANVNGNQNAQAGGASATANTNAAGSAQVSHPSDTKKDDAKHEPGANAGAGPGAAGSAAAGNASAALSSTSSLQAELTKPIDAGKCKPGDEVAAKLTQDFKSDGKVVYHKGSKLIGHVTEAQAHSKQHAESKLGVVFDKVQPKGGEETSIHAVVQALAPPARGMLDSSADQSLSAPAMGGAHGGGGGLLGGVAGSATSTVSSTTGSAGNLAGGVTGGVASNVGSTVNGAAGTGLSAQGTLTNASRGVFGMQGLSLSSVTGATTDASVISSATRTVKLESGTQMLLQLSSAASAK